MYSTVGRIGRAFATVSLAAYRDLAPLLVDKGDKIKLFQGLIRRAPDPTVSWIAYMRLPWLLDYDEARERRGLLPREEVDAATRDALLRRVKEHMENPITDPFRQPTYPNPTNRMKFVVREKVPDA